MKLILLKHCIALILVILMQVLIKGHLVIVIIQLKFFNGKLILLNAIFKVTAVMLN